MDGSIADVIHGNQYNVPTFENERVKVQSAGPCIRVGIKDETGTPHSWWEPRYPFAPPPPDVSWPPQNGWDFTVEAPTPEETRGIFSRGHLRHILTLRVTDPTISPKPVEIRWE